MSTAQIIVSAVFESIGLFVIFRLWTRKRKSSLLSRCFWSIVLLIPLLGLVLYGFVANSPEGHGESLPEYPPDTGSGHI